MYAAAWGLIVLFVLPLLWLLGCALFSGKWS